jgi:phage shock protein PspC (stress-responsive transcriptional regulator)
MKLTENINLAGLIFTIDEDALLKLQNYLNAIERNYRTKEEREEILGDIEARIAELFQAQLNKSKEVIGLSELDKVIEILGMPEEIAGLGEKQETPYYSTMQRSVRMFRDPDNSILGGVCSGLGNYYNIDPVILRVLFVLCLGLGSLFVYIVFWIVLPPVRSLHDKYQMKGHYTKKNIQYKAY